MTELTTEQADLDRARDRLAALLDYVTHMVRLGERTVFSIEQHRNLVLYEHEFHDRVGIQHDLDDGESWIKIERLRRLDPPEVPESLRPWLTVSRNPEDPPVVSSPRMETMSRDQADALVRAGTIDPEDVMKPLKRSDLAGSIVDVQLKIERFEDAGADVKNYISGPWNEWAQSEAPRRKTIEIYEKLFSIHQLIQSEGAERPLELVWGVGLARWATSGMTINHPLVEALVEIEIAEDGGALRVGPRDVQAGVALKPFEQLENPGADAVLRVAGEHFERLSRDPERMFSPFVRESFEPVLRYAANELSETGTYQPDFLSDVTDRSLPEFSDQLMVTNTWVIFARPRSENFVVQDLLGLREAVTSSNPEELPGPATRFVTEPPGHKTYQPTLIDIGGGLYKGPAGLDVGGPTASGESGSEAPDMADSDEASLYFPKPYNESQVAIVQRLAESDGVVVQGPPGTGKTHTIANIICHCLATGKRVLVTSKGEPALSVLREQIPEEVRGLTISLLTSEREGLRQLEQAVGTLAGTVANSNPRSLERQILEHEQAAAQLRESIDKVDSSIIAIASKQLENVPASLRLGSASLAPAELAERVVRDRSAHEWLPDHLGPGPEYDPKFSTDDIVAAREARKIVGDLLVYMDKEVPSRNDLVDTPALTAVHEHLVQASHLERQIHEEGIELMSFLANDAVSRAKQLAEDLLSLAEARGLFVDHPWMARIFDSWIGAGIGSSETALFDEVLAEFDQIEESRRAFVQRPVQLPEEAVDDNVVSAAVERAASGKRPFSILRFGAGVSRYLLKQTTVAGGSPATAEDWAHVGDYLRFRRQVATTATRWNGLAEDFGTPRVDADSNQIVRWATATHALLDQFRDAAISRGERVRTELPELFPYGTDPERALQDAAAARSTANKIDLNVRRHRLGEARLRVSQPVDRLRQMPSPISDRMKSFIEECVGNPKFSNGEISAQWGDLAGELQRIHELKPHLTTIDRVAALVEDSGAREWARSLQHKSVEGIDDPWSPSGWNESWLWRRQDSYLRDIDCREELAELSVKRFEFDEDLKRRMRETVKLRTFFALKVNMTERIQGGLVRFATAIRQIGGGRGIRARRYRRDAREAMRDSYAAVPCWIMPTWRVSESLPPELGSFDLVIVDEASQSDIGALPALLRGRKLLIVGDDKQISPTAAFVEERKILQLRHNYLGDQPFGAMVLPGGSLYDLANAMFPGTRVMLQEHFRCVEPIIRFSMRFYTEPLISLRIPKVSERLDPPLIDIYVPEGRKTRKKINEAEAAVIVDEIERLTQDPKFADRSIGVVSLIGPHHAHYIQKLLLARIGEAAFVRHQIACGDSATFQGKERSIMFVSMVASPPRAAAQTARSAQQRFNVALSRARDRMYLVRSIEASRLNPNDLKAQVIAHFNNPMPGRNPDQEALISKCQSGFERDVFGRLAQLGYCVTPQVSAGPYSIDLVVEGHNDKRLAVELDGDQYHPPEQWHDDLRRQRALERVGWRFWRCWGSSFALDPEGCMEELLKVLGHLAIEPIGSADRRRQYCEHRVVQGGEVQPGDSQIDTPMVEVGDRIRIEYADEEPRRQGVVEISRDVDDPNNGVISVRQPLASALLGAGEEDEVEFKVGSRVRTATVLGIEKGAALPEVNPKKTPMDISESGAHFQTAPDGAESSNPTAVPGPRAAESGTQKDVDAIPKVITPELWRRVADWALANETFSLEERGILFLIADGTFSGSAEIRHGQELMHQAVRLGFEISGD